MNRKYLLVVIATFLFILLDVRCVSAVHSQGLYWGYQEGEEFFFIDSITVTDDEESTTTVEYYKLVDTELSELEDPITNESYAPSARFDVYRNDGTYHEEDFLLGSRVAVPIGNWSLLTEVYEYNLFIKDPPDENVTVSYDFIESADKWGYYWIRVDSFYGMISRDEVKWTYSKQDGVLLEETWNSTQSWNNRSFYDTFTRLPMNPTIQSLIVTGVALGVIISTVVILVYFSKK
ncbi:MAG: hypothetical protein ACFFF4_03200 [Candidatus Thorarchaeota archaeon]